MRWKTYPAEGWHTGFALFPVKLDNGTTVWLERFRYRTGRYGHVVNTLPYSE